MGGEARAVPSAARGHRPRLPRVYVPRNLLWDRLDAATPNALTLLVGPMGSGKSLGVSGWLESRLDEDSRWITADAGWDPARVQEMLLAAQEPAAPAPRLVVVDDAHLLPLASVRLIDERLNEAPESLRVLLLSRWDLPITRLGAELLGHFTVLRGELLRLDERDSAILIAEHARTDSVEVARAVTEHTQGWCAAVVLTSRSLAATRDPLVAARRLRDQESPVADAVATEVFASLPAQDRHLLLCVANEEIVSVETARHLTGDPEAAATLAELETTGLMVTRVGDGATDRARVLSDPSSARRGRAATDRRRWRGRGTGKVHRAACRTPRRRPGRQRQGPPSLVEPEPSRGGRTGAGHRRAPADRPRRRGCRADLRQAAPRRGREPPGCVVRDLRGALVRRRHPPGGALDGQAAAAAAGAPRAARGRDRLHPADAGPARARVARGRRDGGRARAPRPRQRSAAPGRPPASRRARHRPDLAGAARRRADQPRRGDPDRPVERPARVRRFGHEPPGVHVLRAGARTSLRPACHRSARGHGERAGLASSGDDRPGRAGRPAGRPELPALAGRAGGRAGDRPHRPLGGPHREVLAAPTRRPAGAGRRVGRDLSADSCRPRPTCRVCRGTCSWSSSSSVPSCWPWPATSGR